MSESAEKARSSGELGRREFLVGGAASVAALASGAGCARRSRPGADRPNVLFIAIDDLNDWVGVLGGHPAARTPSIDALSRRGVLFTNAYTASPLCGPSRAAVLSGLQPTTTGIYSNAQRWSDAFAPEATLPARFHQAGYQVRGGGKLFHGARPTLAERVGYQLSRVDWVLARQLLRGNVGPWDDYFLPPEFQVPEVRGAEDLRVAPPAFDWGPLAVSETQTSDYQVSEWASRALVKDGDEPFFVACGFFRPHLPWFAPADYFNRFDPLTISPPVSDASDLDDLPREALALIDRRLHEDLARADLIREAVRAYIASIAFVDALVGRVIAALDASGHAENTVVMLWSDHGKHLGQKLHWGKSTLWEEATHVPLVVVAPGTSVEQGRCERPVSLLDLYPTLVELCDLRSPEPLEGESLLPWLLDPEAPRAQPAVMTFMPGNHSVRSERYRYTRYADGGEELYDHAVDPNETANRAADPSLLAIQRDLSRWLPAREAPLRLGAGV